MRELKELPATDSWWPSAAQKLEERLRAKGPQTWIEIKTWAMGQGDEFESRIFDLCSWAITHGNIERVARIAAQPVLCIPGTKVEDRKPDEPDSRATPSAREWNQPPAEAIAKEKASREVAAVVVETATAPARLNAIRERAARTTRAPASATARPADRAVAESKSAAGAVETAIADARRKVAPIAAETLAAHGVLPVRHQKSPATPPPAAPTTEENDMANDWISAEDAAGIIGVSKRYLLDRLRGEEALKSQGGGKGGPAVEFSRASVEKFAAKRTVAGGGNEKTAAAKVSRKQPLGVGTALNGDMRERLRWIIAGYRLNELTTEVMIAKLEELAG